MCNCNCRLCDNIVISDSVTVAAISGISTLLIDIPTATYRNGDHLCLVVAQAIPDTATINMPVAITIGGDTATVYPFVKQNCAQATACSIRARTRYKLVVQTTPVSAAFKSLSCLPCAPNNNLTSIPVS